MSRQMALALFADYSPTDRGVDDAPLDLGFRRNNALVKIVDLSLARRLCRAAGLSATGLDGGCRADCCLWCRSP